MAPLLSRWRQHLVPFFLIKVGCSLKKLVLSSYYWGPRVQKIRRQGKMNLHKRFPHPPPYLPLSDQHKSQMTMFSAQTIQREPLMIIKQTQLSIHIPVSIQLLKHSSSYCSPSPKKTHVMGESDPVREPEEKAERLSLTLYGSVWLSLSFSGPLSLSLALISKNPIYKI